MKPRAQAVLVLAAVLAAAVWARPAAGGEDPFRAIAVAAGQGEPLIRIGLDSAHRLSVSSDAPYRIVYSGTGGPVWKSSYTGETVVVAVGGPEREESRVFRIQVGSFASEAAAEAERARLEREMKAPAIVRKNLDRGTWRVRLGKATERSSLLPLLSKLRAAGFDAAWISDEPAVAQGNVTLRLVDASFESQAVSFWRLAVVPSAGAHVRVEGKPYRGVIELRVSPSGMVRAIDWVSLEPYLLGVVPAELGPDVWPQLEALKAQAVAARTYAWRHLGQFEEEGFDICATPRCQVYGGAAAEHPLSDRAVAATRGEILTWAGKPISALYTATCGGHTEDASEVFPEEAAPYLVGVPCRAEDPLIAVLGIALEGSKVPEVIAENGDDVTRDWALLSKAGVLDRGGQASDPRAAAGAADVSRWASAVARLAGLGEPPPPPGTARSLAQAAADLLAAVGWDERASLLLAEQDLALILRDPETASLPERERRALAYLAGTGALRPFPDGGFKASRPATASRLAPALARIGDAYDAFGLQDAVVSGRSEDSVRFSMGRGELTLRLSRSAALFALTAGRPVSVERLEVRPGDRVRFRTGVDGSVDFLEVRGPVKGASDDRLSSVYSWEVRRSREELEEAIDRKLAVGRLENLEVVRRGKSGRIVELRVTGARGSATVRGFDIRGLLDLREDLTVFELQRDRTGVLTAAVFAGKGWGHGVGLCQVGAYGMALRGSTYREILSHYYRGAKIERITAARTEAR